MSALGAFAEGQRHGAEALRLATLAGRGTTPIITHGYLGELYLAQGDLEHAIRVLEQGLALCRASGNRTWLRVIVAGLGYASTLQGRFAEGCALLEEAIRESIRTGELLGRYIAEERDSARLLRSCHECLRAARNGDDRARSDRLAGIEAKVDALGRSVDELRQIVCGASVGTNSS